MKRLAAALLVCTAIASGAVACGPSPAAETPAPTGTLVIVIRQGPERVPFQPKVDRIRRANEQLAAILGHSIQIELDGSLLPQDHDGAQDVMARLVETVAQDVDAIKRHEPEAMAFTAATFERLVVRYSPAEAAKRGRLRGQLDRTSKTLDIVLEESRWLALDRSDIASPILRLFGGDQKARYARVLPDQLPANEHDAWLEFHMHRSRNAAEPGQVLGQVDALLVRGAVMIAQEGNAKARKYLITSVFSDFAATYQEHGAETAAAPPGSAFRVAESTYLPWIIAAVPSMSVEEREEIARYLWVHDFKRSGERDPWMAHAFPGFDRMAFGFAQSDAWVASGHPARVRLYDEVVAPVEQDTSHGDLRYNGQGSQPHFYRWALAAAPREDEFVKNLLQRRDPRQVMTAFYNAHSALRDEADYLRFLRRFESSPSHWRAGADVHRAVIFRPSTAVLEEARRHWREVPMARAHALLYFARHADGSYHPEVDWPDMLQDRKPDDVVLKETLALGWPGYELLPVFWQEVPRSSGRLAIVEAAALDLLGKDIHVRPGDKGIAGVLAAIGRKDCEDDDRAEVAALRKWAEEQIPSHPGQGLSQILEATDAKECKPKRRPAPPPKKTPPKPARPKWKEGDPLPPKDPF